NGKTVDKNNLKLLFVGQLWEAKGADLAIRSLSRLEEHGISAILTIVGDGKKSYKRDLRKIAKENDIIDRVDFVGKVTREELKNFYRDNDILLFPTYSWYKEPFGIVILEAMNQGISVIASNSGGPKEIITDGENGLLFESGKVESLTKKIINLVKAPQLYKGIRKKAFDSINDIFNIAFVGKRIIMFYNNIL
ncbi:glycosyltransferase family 4 protein, partial [candidate division WOR-3 bacterium]|nr:glycosyltransferase family 4 protein [candidate division WOR-3 bacterium]